MTLSSQSLIVRLFPSLNTSSALLGMVFAFLGTLALTAAAKISIPLYPVPITMQTFVVIFLGCLYGRNLAVATIALYLFEGALGLPVFQGTPERGLGLAYMCGPTGGYLLGFLASAFVVGTLSERGLGRTYASAASLFILGGLVIDLPGLSWLTYLMGQDVAQAAFVNYQLGFVLKSGLGAVMIPMIWKRLEKKA